MDVARAQARLDMAYRDSLVVGSQCTGHGGGRIAVHQHQIRLFHRQHWAQALQHVRGEVREILPRLHHIQIVMRLDLEPIQHMIEHLPVLKCGVNFYLQRAIAFHELPVSAPKPWRQDQPVYWCFSNSS